MSEGDVNLIRDEDVLRRMWQQTEDFGRKKEIRAHMYRLREERLRNLYSPEPTPAKGCEFSTGQAHVDSFADQTFQSMKSKEVRDAGSPPKEFNYRGQDLKELSNAGWNVESEDRTTDDGRTHVKSVNANIEGRYDVEGGRGQFAAVDRQRQAVTEYQDDNSKMRRDETSSSTAAHEHVERQTDDGTKFASTTSSSNTSSKFQQVSSTIHETPAIHDYDQTTHNTNRNENITRTTNTEQNLRSNDFQNGDLVSRKIDYPDDNTKVIVETRCLPDGTRVTSTRREFRAPVQSTRSEYQTKSESKSYSSQQKSDTRECSSKTIRHTSDGRTDDIVDSQRHVDNDDFKRQLREYTVDDDTNSETHRTKRRHETINRNVTGHSQIDDNFSQTRYETKVKNKMIDRSTNVRDVRDDYTQVHKQTNQRFVDNVDQTDRREVIETYDDHNVSRKDIKETHRVRDTDERIRNVPRDTNEPSWTPTGPYETGRNAPRVSDEASHEVPKGTEERVHNINKVTDEQTTNITRDTKSHDTKLEEVVERKTNSDNYRTTYQSDFQQKKVSNDWSPTHQAWASTLRADTPNTTHPSTRASSPGSRTFKSSTSSIRSSVSPDKNRKPSSRGGSPSKVDRYSPTRSINSDRYSSTHTTHSVTETRTNKHMSPERKPPTGLRSTAGFSPERKQSDSHRQRPSVSPEKQPHNFATRPSASPERKITPKTPTAGYPRNASPTRAAGLPSGPRQSPERRSYIPSDEKTCPDYSSPTSPYRSHTSPERKPTNNISESSVPKTSPSTDKKRPDATQKKAKESPEREVSYRKPTPSREPQDSTKRPSVSPDRKPGYMKPTAASQPTLDTKIPSKPGEAPGIDSPLQNPHHGQSVTKTQVKEDHYKFIDEETKMHTRIDKTHLPQDKTPTPTRKSPGKDSPDFSESPLPRRRTPSPQKKTVIVTENDELYGRIDKTIELVDITTKHNKKTDDIHSVKCTPKDKEVPSKESSPSKFGTYDKNKTHDTMETTEVSNVKYDSLKHRDKTSPKKVQESTSPTKKNSRDSKSPVKSPTKDTKYQYTTDFISTERTTEEVNKKPITKDHPRQLVTPSSSPTRKPKDETEPSTGQSSPTTSVSGFVYFGSPRTEKPIVTDLDDDFESVTDYQDEPQHTRPESLDLTGSTSPSKIPCRSPSPEKRDTPTRESLPRKSSLKKPSNYVNPTSPIDKPPSSFRVSPTEDHSVITAHDIVKKDQPGEPETHKAPMKVKPPLTRRETYEDRCRLILGMVDTTSTENITKETKKTKKPDVDKSSPSTSPSDNPVLQEPSIFPGFSTQETVANTQTDVTNFISKEQEDLIKTTKIREHKSKIPSRETSPAKIQDITSNITTVTQTDSMAQKKDTDVITITETKNKLPRQSPENINRHPSASPERRAKPIDNKFSHKDDYPRVTASTKLPRLSASPERKQSLPVRESPDKKPNDQQPSPTRTIKISSYDETITTENTEFDATSTTENTKADSTTTTKTTKEKSPRTRVLQSPTRQTPASTLEHSALETSSKPRPINSSPTTGNQSPERIFGTQQQDESPAKFEDKCPEKKSPHNPRESPERTPGYMKTTTVISSKYDKSLTSKDVGVTTKTVDKNITKNSVSPTRKISQHVSQSASPTKSSHPTTGVDKKERSPERKPSKDVSAKIPQSKDSIATDLPGFMKTTASTTSKNHINITENINETITSKTVEQTHLSSQPSKSPTRKVSGPRTPSPTKFTRQSSVTSSPKKADISPERKPAPKHPASPTKDDFTKKPKETMPSDRSSTRLSTDTTPDYIKTTTSLSSKYGTDEYDFTIEDTQKIITSKTTERKYPISGESPTHNSMKPINKSSPEYLRSGSPSRPTEGTPKRPELSPERKLGYQRPTKTTSTNKPKDEYPEDSSSTCVITTTDLLSHFDSTSTTEDYEKTTSTDQTTHPLKPSNKSLIEKGTLTKVPKDKPTDRSTSARPSVSPDRKPSYMKPTASVTSKYETTTITQDTQEINTLDTLARKQPKKSPSHQSPEKTTKDKSSTLPKPEEPRQLRTPSPTKKTIKVTEISTDFLISEREQEILDRVQKSLRKLSPERKEKSPIRERSPNKTTTSLHDLNITNTESLETHNIRTEDSEEHVTKLDVTLPGKPKVDKYKDQKIPSKTSSRNVSPIKRAPSVATPSKIENSPESKSRSISPRKPISQTDRPQSPHGARGSGIRPRDQVPFNRKPTPANLSTYKIDKLTTDVKKTNGITKQSVVTKTTVASKSTTSRLVSPQTTKPSEPETKRIPSQKDVKENVLSRKETVTRTSSESNMKPKKTSPQRMKSKPEIQVNDLSTKSPKYQKPIIREPYAKLPAKPKSATALNTSTDDDDDIIIDVQQSKSSRENSPDRICPTPVNFADDVGTPRFPDEVSEPDDEYRKRSYHTIHETESVVDDIVEICEDEELFVKHDVTSEYDDSLLSVNDKVNKFTNKIKSVTKPKDTTKTFKDIERKVHSDFIDENIKSDECLLSVSEKVTKFAMGPKDTKDSQSPSRKITDEYDRNTVYQDDYTKLSVNDKAHLFVETAENIKVPKVKLAQKVDRPDLSNVDESLKTDNCLLSVSDKVNKFVKTAENFLTETHKVDQKERKIKEQHEKIMKQIVNEDDEDDDETHEINECTTTKSLEKTVDNRDDQPKSYKKENKPQSKANYFSSSPKAKLIDRTPTVKITTLRSSEAVKKAKALFENIASTQNNKDVTTAKTTKLTDIGVVKKSPKTDSTIVLHPSVEDVSRNVTNVDSEVDGSLHTPRTRENSSGTLTKPHHPHEKPRASPNRLTASSPEVPRAKSPMRQNVEITTTKTVSSRYPVVGRAESPRNRAQSPRHRPESEKPDKVPGYLRPTKTSQIKEESKVEEENEVSTRRGSGKFGVELRRTSFERSTVSSERRRSVEHHQPCIEDIFDLDLLEQMLEKVVGYEQRRRIRSQIRVVKNQSEHVETQTYTKTKHITSVPKPRAPEQHIAKSPERVLKSTPQKTTTSDRLSKTPQKTYPERSQPNEPTAQIMNGHTKESVKPESTSHLRSHSPEKPAPKSIRSAKSPIRHPSPVKKRTVSPTKTVPKLTSSRFNEYASAYMKKVGLNEANKVKIADKKTKKTTETKQSVSHETQDRTSQEFTTSKSFTSTTERTSSRDVIEIVQINGKRSPSPEKITGILRKPHSPERVYSPVGKAFSPERRVHSPVSKAPERKAHSPERNAYSPMNKTPESERKTQSPEHKAQSPERMIQNPERRTMSPSERIYQRTPSPEFKRQKSGTKKETIIKTVYDIEKKIPTKLVQEEKPSWITNRNLKKISSETRTFSSKKLEAEKPKYRAASPSKVISKPIDVITSSYGPGPLDAEGRPLFGIKALRNSATNFQVKGTVIRQEFHSRNGGEPEGTVSVTAYSSQPEELEQLMASQGVEPPSRIHGLSAITTTKKFGGDTGISMSSVNTREERASLEHFTHADRKMDSQINNLETCSFDTRKEVIEGSRQVDSTKTVRNDRSDRKREERVTEVRKGHKEERREKVERREDKKTVRQSSVKSLTEKFIKSANDSGKTDRSSYPKAGLILRTTSTLRDSVSSDDAHPGLGRADSELSIGSVDDVVVTTSTDRGGAITTTTRTSRHHGPTTTQRTSTVTHHEPIITTKKTTTVITGSQEPVVTRVVTQGPVVTKTVTGQRQEATVTEKSFLDSNTKVTGVQDILTRMKNADIVIEDGDTSEDSEARALLNKFLGATVLMAGMQSYVSDQPSTKLILNKETVRTSSGGNKVTKTRVEDLDLDQCWDERLLRKLLDECTDYEQRRRLRARIRSLMAEQEACAAAVTDALGAAHITSETDGAGGGGADSREEEEVTVSSSVRRDSSEKTSSSSTTKTSKVIESVSQPAPKPVSPFAKFRQLEKQNSTNSPNSPKSPQSPQSPGSPSQPYFKFTDPALQCSALTIKERLLQWCRDKTRDYENVKLENFSTSWADGLAFCALLHHFLPDAFDYSKLTPETRRHNFTLAFKVADEKAGIYPLLDVDDMVAMRKPDWKCVFTYVQSIYRRFKDEV